MSLKLKSRFGFQRVRGIGGCYFVQIDHVLKPTEIGEVWGARQRDRHCGSCGRQRPIEIKKLDPDGTITVVEEVSEEDYQQPIISGQGSSRVERAPNFDRIETYRIGDLLVGDRITIIVSDINLPIVQTTVHTCLMDGFRHETIPFTHRFELDGEMHEVMWKAPRLNPIEIYDLNIGSEPIAIVGKTPKPLLLAPPKKGEQITDKLDAFFRGLLIEAPKEH